MPCSPISVNLPSGPSGPAIPGFGIPFALKTPDLSGFIDGFPENLLELLEKLQLLIPSGAFKPQLSLNFGKDAFDAILKLLDQFMPFLMLYKFFLPILNLIICIIEVLCAIPSPYKITRAMIRLFRNCLPPFLNLFPFLALIIMIISLILLLIALIEYIIGQIIKLIELIIKNILMLSEAFNQADSKGVLLIVTKIGAVLCIFQNLFVLLSIFTVIIQVIKDMLALSFSIPPCDDNAAESCCDSSTCPAIIKNGNYTRITGTLKYLNTVSAVNVIPGLPADVGTFTTNIRSETWQLFDTNQEIAQRFINIIDGFDVLPDPELLGKKPSFFPTDAVYSKDTAPKQAPYRIDLRLYYNPANWGRSAPEDGLPRYIRFKDCIVLKEPTPYYYNYNNSTIPLDNGTFNINGGVGYEDDGVTPLKAYDSAGINIVPGLTANISNFLHIADKRDPSPVLFEGDGYSFFNAEYTFKPNAEALLNKNLITAGCLPELSVNKNFINQIFATDLAVKTEQLVGLVNSPSFPDTAKTQQELESAIAVFSNNVNIDGANQMKDAMTASLENLKGNALDSLGKLIGFGFDSSKSDFTLEPKVQFTSKPIKISVNIRESSGVSLTSGLPPEIVEDLANKIKAVPTFGSVGKFTYDGYQVFTADLTSTQPGNGQMTLYFNNQLFVKTTIPADIDILPSQEPQTVDYQFIFTPTGLTIPTVSTGVGDTSDGSQPRRESSDLVTEGNISKDGL
jgi:hypothetical protein